MSANAVRTRELELSGLDGTNPLGFLAAVGALVVAHSIGDVKTRLRWRRARTWVPVIDGMLATAPAEFSAAIAQGLRGREVAQDAEKTRVTAQRQADAAKKALADKKKDIRKRGLKGADRKAAMQSEALPLEQVYEQRRREALDALVDAVPRNELALGKRIDCTDHEYRQHALEARKNATRDDREELDLLAAFGSDAALDKNRDGSIEPTPFEFIKGSGHQFFLETVSQLIQHVSNEGVRQALFEPWTYRDETLSLRWDPTEDRRYALSERDPSTEASGTVWMANLLAYRALALFSSAAAQRRGLAITGWSTEDEDLVFTWPLWQFAAPPDTVRSLLQLRELISRLPGRPTLRARGVAVAFRARRIKVGTGANYKLNFSPARPLL